MSNIGELLTWFQEAGLLLSDQEMEPQTDRLPLLREEDLLDALWLGLRI